VLTIKSVTQHVLHAACCYHNYRLVFDGCCVDAPIRHFASVLSKLRNLSALDLADPSGVLTVEQGSTLPRCFVDSTSTLLTAAGGETGTAG
jgi:hypothetical protein